MQGYLKVTENDYNHSYGLILNIWPTDEPHARIAIPVPKELGTLQLAQFAIDLRQIADFVERHLGA